MKPWRKVVKKLGLMSGRGSVLGPDTTRRTRWWILKLDCGHEVERTVKYKPRDGYVIRGGTQHRSRSDVGPHPKKVRCEYCPNQ